MTKIIELPLNKIILGDCVEVMRGFPENSIDCIVTDPPYGMSFMGKEWDKALPPIEAFKEMCRVLKPGALAFVMSSPRQDLMWRMMKLLEDSGFEMKQSFLSWIYKTGFPKAFDVSSNIGKRIDSYICKGIDNYNSWEEPESTTLSKTANIVEKLYLKNLIETGINTTSKDTVATDVSAYLSQRKLNVDVNIVEKRLSEVHLTSGITFFVVENADMIQQLLNSPVKIAELNLREQDQIIHVNLVFVQLNALTYFTPKTQELIIKVEEAQRIENGENWVWNEMAINAVIVEVLNDFKHIISTQLKNTLNLDMKSQMESRSAINVIITESIKECLTSVMVDMLGIRIKEKYKGLKSQTSLKPATEPVLMVNKPRSEKTIVDNVLRWGTGAMNVDACRIPFEENPTGVYGTSNKNCTPSFNASINQHDFESSPHDKGRFPANLLVSDGALDTGKITKYAVTKGLSKGKDKFFRDIEYNEYKTGYTDVGDQSRFFDLDAWSQHHGILDVPKPDKAERDYGLRNQPKIVMEIGDDRPSGRSWERRDKKQTIARSNVHPTVKPIKLMAYLIELGCPLGGIVMDPFVGSGTTCIAAKQLSRKYVGIEIDEKYHRLAEARLAAYPDPLTWFTEEMQVND